MNYDNSNARVDSTSKWSKSFSYQQLRVLYKESIEISHMVYGRERREKLLALLRKGFRVRLNFSYGGKWNSKDNDIKYLLKKNKICRHKQYEHSAITEHFSHTFIGIA
jgi:hypothetical protein